MQKTNLIIIGISLIAFLFSACVKDPVIQNDEEVITTLKYMLTPTSGGSAVMFTFQDLDGDGGNDPVITNGILSANTSYTGAIVLLNETENPADSISNEVAEEDADHQFFFESTLTGLDIQYNDTDDNGNPVGLATTVTTGAAGTGSLKITLRHEPNKSGTGVSTGDITNAGGETDIEVNFTVDVQ